MVGASIPNATHRRTSSCNDVMTLTQHTDSSLQAPLMNEWRGLGVMTQHNTQTRVSHLLWWTSGGYAVEWLQRNTQTQIARLLRWMSAGIQCDDSNATQTQISHFLWWLSVMTLNVTHRIRSFTSSDEWVQGFSVMTLTQHTDSALPPPLMNKCRGFSVMTLTQHTDSDLPPPLMNKCRGFSVMTLTQHTDSDLPPPLMNKCRGFSVMTLTQHTDSDLPPPLMNKCRGFSVLTFLLLRRRGSFYMMEGSGNKHRQTT